MSDVQSQISETADLKKRSFYDTKSVGPGVPATPRAASRGLKPLGLPLAQLGSCHPKKERKS